MLEKLAQVLLRVCVRPGPHARPDSDHKSRERREEIKSLPRENVGKRYFSTLLEGNSRVTDPHVQRRKDRQVTPNQII